MVCTALAGQTAWHGMAWQDVAWHGNTCVATHGMASRTAPAHNRANAHRRCAFRAAMGFPHLRVTNTMTAIQGCSDSAMYTLAAAMSKMAGLCTDGGRGGAV